MEPNDSREPEAPTPRQLDERCGRDSGPAACNWLVVAASQAGAAHLRRGEPCADRFEITQAGGALILAVADGAGSAARGAEGAALAASTAARLAAASLMVAAPPAEAAAQRELVRDVLRQTLAAVQQEIGMLTGARRSSPGLVPPPAPLADVPPAAAMRGTPRPERLPGQSPAPLPDASAPAPRSHAPCFLAAAVEPPAPASPADFSSTLLLAILTDTSLMVGNIGDGWLVTRDRQGGLRAAAPPSRCEYVNETFFLTSAGALDDAVIAVLPAAELDAMALMSDGSAWFAIDLEQRAPSGPLFTKLFAFAGDAAPSAREKDREIAAFLAQPAICRKTDDDKTLILVVRPATAAAPADDVR